MPETYVPGLDTFPMHLIECLLLEFLPCVGKARSESDQLLIGAQLLKLET